MKQTTGKIETPIRSCCGKRHNGPACPDGKVMCCLCYERVEIDQLADSEGGKKVNVCKPCFEKKALVLINVAEGCKFVRFN